MPDPIERVCTRVRPGLLPYGYALDDGPKCVLPMNEVNFTVHLCKLMWLALCLHELKVVEGNPGVDHGEGGRGAMVVGDVLAFDVGVCDGSPDRVAKRGPVGHWTEYGHGKHAQVGREKREWFKEDHALNAQLLDAFMQATQRQDCPRAAANDGQVCARGEHLNDGCHA